MLKVGPHPHILLPTFFFELGKQPNTSSSEAMDAMAGGSERDVNFLTNSTTLTAAGPPPPPAYSPPPTQPVRSSSRLFLSYYIIGPETSLRYPFTPR
jgi:hypothetical protein